MLAVIIVCSLPSSNVFAQWQSFEVDTITRVPSEYQTFHQSLTVEDDGTVYAMWRRRFRNPTRNCILLSFKPQGGSWSEPIVVAEGYRRAAMVVDRHTGVQHIFARDFDNEFRITHLNYLRRLGTEIESEIVATDSLRVSHHSVFVDQSGYLHVVWLTEISLRTVRVAYLTNKNGDWNKEIIDAIELYGFELEMGPQILVTDQNQVVIAYIRAGFGGANAFVLLKKQQKNWQVDNIPFSGNDFGERAVDIAADSSGGLHFVVSGWEGEDLFGKTYYFFRSPAGFWQGPEELPQSVGPGLISIQTDRFGNPHIVWESHSLFFPPGDAFYSYKNETGEWQSQPIIEQRNQGGSVSPTFVMDAEGNGHLVLVYFTNSRPDSAHLVYMKSENLVTAVEPTKSGKIPEAFELASNYPNPFRSQTRLQYHLGASGTVTLEVFDLSGRLIQRQVETHGQPGKHVISWNGKDRFENAVSNGVYFYWIHFLSSHGFCRAISAGKLLKLQ